MSNPADTMRVTTGVFSGLAMAWMGLSLHSEKEKWLPLMTEVYERSHPDVYVADMLVMPFWPCSGQGITRGMTVTYNVRFKPTGDELMDDAIIAKGHLCTAHHGEHIELAHDWFPFDGYEKKTLD